MNPTQSAVAEWRGSSAVRSGDGVASGAVT